MTKDPLSPGHPARPAPTASPSPPGTAGRPVPLAVGQPFLPGPRRDDDRRVAVASVVLAAGFLLAAAAAAGARTLGAPVSPWLPLHLALAGGASTAIAGVMPFFVAALAAGRPAPRAVRASAVALVALGGALVGVRGVAPGSSLVPALGGVLFLAGIALTAWAVRRSGRAGLMVRRPIVTLGYTLALGNVAVGAAIGTLGVAGWLPVLERWAQLRPAHAWINVLGFVSLVIVATLLHFLPTVLGTRIVPRRSAILAVLGLAMGAPVVVVGLALGSREIAGGGAVLTMLGAAALVVEALRLVRSRGRWTTDPGWHRFASWGLLAGVGWFTAGVTVASLLVLVRGASADAWDTAMVGVPLALGWVVQVLMASWTHLLPSIGPGGPPDHARQRIVLGRIATARLVALNGGAALLAVGWPGGLPALALTGGLLAGGAVVSSVALALAALRGRS